MTMQSFLNAIKANYIIQAVQVYVVHIR